MTIRVNVVMGGPSAEHEISLRSGAEVLRHLDRKKYTTRGIVVSHAREFFWCDVASEPPSLDSLRQPARSGSLKGPVLPAQSAALWSDCDVAFLALHGAFGEDGLFQGFLETLGVPYTGSDVYASAVGMNKITTRTIFQAAGLTVAPGSVITTGMPPDIDALVDRHGFPCFVKCPQSGSSRLMGRATDRASLVKLIDELRPESDRLLVETAIRGTEFSCPVLQRPDQTVSALPPVEIRPRTSSYFDFEAKYADNASEEIVPVPHPPSVVERIREIAFTAHTVTGCNGVSRTDMILHNDTFYVLEINTLPGLTPNSLVPKSFTSMGGTYGSLLDILIQSALASRRK